MGKIAILFPGQGAQFVGMGQTLSAQSATAKDVFDKIDAIRPGTSQLCFEGPAEDLNKTINTQPCIFAVELATFATLKDMGIRANALAGFSLGEITGLAAAEMVNLKDGLKLVTKRGQAMEQATKEFDATMIAVLKLDEPTIEALCKEFKQCYPVNYNCPGQLVVALLKSDMDGFMERVKALKGRGIPLGLSGGFHSPFMTYATKLLEKEIFGLTFSQGSVPLYANATALPYPDTSVEIRGQLLYQINHPVLWEKTIRGMINEGFTTFIECGPGKTLAGLLKKIDSSVTCYNSDALINNYYESQKAGKEWSLEC